MNWNESLKSILDQHTPIDNVTLSFDNVETRVSPIVKASLVMLAKLSTEGKNNNIFVFPEIAKTGFEFVIAKTVMDILAGRIDSTYDPHSFKKGQKLRYEDCIVVFEEVADHDNDGLERIWISFSNPHARRGIPIKLAPFFQKVDSKKISTAKAFNKTYSAKHKEHEAKIDALNANSLKTLKDNKTHLTDSIVYVTRVQSTRNYLLTALLNGNKLSDVLYLAQIGNDGMLNNVSSGQMTGNPAIAIASDLYKVINAMSNGLKVHRIIFDASVSNNLNQQLDAFDQLISEKIPITCIADTVNSMDTRHLKARNFLEWRWNKQSITEDLYVNELNVPVKKRIINCSQHQVNYLNVEDKFISNALTLLYRQREQIQGQSSKLMNVYDKLFSMTTNFMRAIVPFTITQKRHFIDILDECEEIVNAEKRFISSEMFKDLLTISDLLRGFVSNNQALQKVIMLQQLLNSNNWSHVCIVVHESQDKLAAIKYWNDWKMSTCIKTEITIVYTKEYQNSKSLLSDITIIPSWFRNETVKSIIYHYVSSTYYMLLYKQEERWKTKAVSFWTNVTQDTDNHVIADTVLGKQDNGVKEVLNLPVSNTAVLDAPVEVEDDLEQMEKRLLERRYRSYSSSSSDGHTVINAIPVSFVGGLLAFYKTGHKVITVTDIIERKAKEMVLKNAEDISIGEFIVVRESEKEIIRELADIILKNDGNNELRSYSQKWRDSLKVELLFSSNDEIVEKICAAGCRKEKSTILNWITNDELISPQSKEDLIYIAKATNDDVLLEKADLYFKACTEVRSAHRKAGHLLSERLSRTIHLRLDEMNELDPFNVWDPIEVKLEDIGTVKILKVIDIGSQILVEQINTNRLLSE
ncbi:MAG: DrmE family protein [Solobacterium sp.]|nr:DrmE family protein [Solobacterium sp.]